MDVAWPRLRLSLVSAAGAVAYLLTVCLTGTDAAAGDLDTKRTAKCDIQFSGDIEEGDASKLVVALKSQDFASTARAATSAKPSNS